MKKSFLTGLVLLLPAAVTLAFLWFLIDFFTEPFLNFVSNAIREWDLFSGGFLFLSPEQVIHYISRILILIVLFGLIVLLGVLARVFFLHTLLRFFEDLLLRIPLLNTIYKTLQDLTKTLFNSNKNSFKQVVMVPFPRPGIYVLGFVAQDAPPLCSQAAEAPLVSVLVPATPNPTTGFLLMVRREDLLFLEMKAEEALKYIISCGILSPEAS